MGMPVIELGFVEKDSEYKRAECERITLGLSCYLKNRIACYLIRLSMHFFAAKHAMFFFTKPECHIHQKPFWQWLLKFNRISVALPKGVRRNTF